MPEVPSGELNTISNIPVGKEIAQDAFACGIEGLRLLHDFIPPAEEQVVRQCLVPISSCACLATIAFTMHFNVSLRAPGVA